MSIVDIVEFPFSWPDAPNNTPTFSSLLMDATGEEAAHVFPVPKSGTIEKIGFAIGTVTVSNSMSVGLVTTDAGGLPTTTDYGGSAPGIFTPSANTMMEVTLATPATATVGDPIAIRFSFDTYVAGNLNIKTVSRSDTNFNIPHCNTFAGGSWSAAPLNGQQPICYLVYSGGQVVVVPGAAAYQTVTTKSVTAVSTPDEVGMVFMPPFSGNIIGFRVKANTGGGGGTTTVKLYDSADTVLATTVITNAKYPKNAVLSQFIPLPSTAVVSTGIYRLTVKTTGTINFFYYDNGTSNAKVAHGAVDCYATERKSSGAWTDSTLKTFAGAVIMNALVALTVTPDAVISSPAGSWNQRKAFRMRCEEEYRADKNPVSPKEFVLTRRISSVNEHKDSAKVVSDEFAQKMKLR